MSDGAASPAALCGRFDRHLLRSGLLDDESHILVALSGGLDSVVLLDLLRRRGTPVSAAHFDHAMRDDSAADARWVRALCAACNVPLIDGRSADPPRGEAAARDQRYTFLQDAASRARASVIVTAHHADDQAETILFRLARGTGLTGLAGIPDRRGNIARPLLPFSRASIEAYARAERLEWRDDVTNSDVRYARNQIRHVVLPALEHARPGATRQIARMAAHAAEAESAWREVVRGALADVVTGRGERAYTLARDRFLAYHPHVRARIFRHLIGVLGGRLDRSALRSALAFAEQGASGGRIELAHAVRLAREFDQLRLYGEDAGPPPAEQAVRINVAEAGRGVLIIAGRHYAVQWSLDPDPAGAGERVAFDLSSLRFPLELRGWRAGDRIRLAGGTRKLKKLFQENRVGRSRRSAVPVLTDATGEVLWVAGVARSARSNVAADGPAFEIMVDDVASG